jgi:hypothetical protein
MSMHEESTAAVNRPMMGIFNNLGIYKTINAEYRRVNSQF